MKFQNYLAGVIGSEQFSASNPKYKEVFGYLYQDRHAPVNFIELWELMIRLARLINANSELPEMLRGPDKLKLCVTEICSALEQTADPLLLAEWVKVLITTQEPFAEGNELVAAALSAWVLFRSGLTMPDLAERYYAKHCAQHDHFDQ